jgi:hypothetical protein
VAALIAVAGRAQLTVDQQLDNAVFAAENIQQSAQTASSVSDNLALQIVINAPMPISFTITLFPRSMQRSMKPIMQFTGQTKPAFSLAMHSE